MTWSYGSDNKIKSMLPQDIVRRRVGVFLGAAVSSNKTIKRHVIGPTRKTVPLSLYEPLRQTMTYVQYRP